MTPEHQEFMRKRGDFMVVYGVVHTLKEVGRDHTIPTDSENAESYRADCGLESQSWSMPSQAIVGAEFVESLGEALNRGYRICLDCLPGAEEE